MLLHHQSGIMHTAAAAAAAVSRLLYSAVPQCPSETLKMVATFYLTFVFLLFFPVLVLVLVGIGL